MEEELEKQPLYSVGITESSALLRICGRASYLNCASLSEFFQKCNKTEIIIDFKECLGMDSTFLGIIAGASLEMQRIHKDSRLILVHLSERNLELIKKSGSPFDLPSRFGEERSLSWKIYGGTGV